MPDDRSITDIGKEYKKMDEKDLFDRFYKALPITSGAWNNLYQDIQAMAQVAAADIKQVQL